MKQLWTPQWHMPNWPAQHSPQLNSTTDDTAAAQREQAGQPASVCTAVWPALLHRGGFPRHNTNLQGPRSSIASQHRSGSPLLFCVAHFVTASGVVVGAVAHQFDVLVCRLRPVLLLLLELSHADANNAPDAGNT